MCYFCNYQIRNYPIILDSNLGQQSQVTELGWDWDGISNFCKLGRGHCLDTTLLKHWKKQESLGNSKNLGYFWCGVAMTLRYMQGSLLWILSQYPRKQKKLMCSVSSDSLHRSLNCICMWDFRIHTCFLPLRTRMAQCPFCLSQISSYVKYQCVFYTTYPVHFFLFIFDQRVLEQLSSSFQILCKCFPSNNLSISSKSE